MSYKSDTIKNIIVGINNNKYLLPAIQREMVWNYVQIEKLFDSVLSGYPFGSLLFWKYKKDKKNNDYKFYEFIKKYDEYEKKSNHNQEHRIEGKDEITGVLDGQQRLTALFIGLMGYVNLHKIKTKWESANNFEKKYLYINLLYNKAISEDNDEDDILPDYQFKFKTELQIERDNNNGNFLWFKIGNILDWKEKKDWKDIIKNKTISEEQRDNIENICSSLYDNFINEKNPRINYYEETTDSLDKVLNIFVRINSGGTQLDYTDFLMSIIVNQWVESRDQINNTIDNINKDHNFNLPKDIFLRGCLFLINSNLNFKGDNFKQETITNIKSNFVSISQYIKASCSIFNNLGYSKDNLRSNLILLPLALFLMKNKKTKLENDDLKKVKKWVQLSILNRVFGTQTTTYLTKLRSEIKWEGSFPLEDIIKVSNQNNKNMDLNEERLDEVIEKARKGSQDSWSLLTLLYPYNNYRDIVFHEDHIYPYSELTKEQKNIGGDFIANLQLLEGSDNQSKYVTSPNQWIEEYCQKKNIEVMKYKENNFIPMLDLTLDKFDDFIRQRKELIKNNILKQLKG